MARTTASEDRIPFKIHPRVFEALGADLVTNDIVAVIELVKNSYDAFAYEVKIAIRTDDPSNPYLEIFDNGVGMDRRTLKEAWCLVATPNRKDSPVVERGGKKRRASGNKGLGRLSAARLGRRLEVVTKASDEVCLRLTVDWRAIASTDSLEECYVNVSPFQGACPFTKTGTRLRILGLYEVWDEEEIAELRDNLGRLVSPFAKVDDFEIQFSASAEEADGVPTRIIPPEFLSHPPYAIRGLFTAKGEIRARYEFRPMRRGIKPRQKTLTVEWNKLRESSEVPLRLKRALPTCGPFEFEIRAWDIGPEDAAEIADHFNIKKQNVRPAIRAHKGLSVYRDGILVLPKSEGTRDWLGLDLRRVSKVGERLSTSQLVGYVAITADHNPKIEDTSDREGLVKNESVSVFQAVLKGIVASLENERAQDRLSREDETKLAALLDGVSATELVTDVERLTDEEADPEEVVVRVRGFAEHLEDVREAIKKRFFYYSRLATVGTIAQMLVHEIRNRTTSLGRFMRIARESPCAETADFSKPLDLASSSVQALESLANTFAPLASRGFRRGRRDALLHESVARCLGILETDFKKAGIEVASSSIANIKVNADPGELDTIFLNLIANAAYWTPKSKRNPKIEISARKIGDGKKVRVSIHDSGPGVSEEDAEKIFLPGVTRKPDGIGMGLTVAAELVSEYGNNILLETPGKLEGASFTFDLPLKD